MKTLYSSTFLTAVLAFLALLGKTGTPVTLVQDASLTPSFQTIIEPIGPSPETPSRGGVRLEIFNTFDCQACDLFGQGILPQLVNKYAESQDVKLRLYLVPDKDNEGEFYATRGAHCASRHDRFWEMGYELHRSEGLNRREVDITGQGLELPIVEFRNCLNSEEFDEQIDSDIAYAKAKNVTQKPAIFVNDILLLGSQPIENIDRMINRALTD